MTPVAVLATGMVTGVGLTAPATCAAMRAALDGFKETRFMNTEGEWVIGCPVPMDPPLRGLAKLTQIAAGAIRECLGFAQGEKPEAIPLLLCVAEKQRIGRVVGLDDRLLSDIQAALGVRFHSSSRVLARGRVGGVVAIDLARRIMADERVTRCLVAGVDSFLVGPTLSHYEAQDRLLTPKNSNGFIPGEAGAAVLIGLAGPPAAAELRCSAVGFGRERATINTEEPFRADGLVDAFRALRQDGGVSLNDADYRYTDCNGEQYGFKQDRLAITRMMRIIKARFDHLHPADSIGEIGAAVGPCVFGLALTAARKGYAPGRGVLCHFSNDDDDRAAVIFRFGEEYGKP